MMFSARVVLMAWLTASLISGAETVMCPTDIVVVDVTTLAEAQHLTDVIDCTGPGVFNVTWTTSLQIGTRIDVSDMKNVTITGTGFPTIGSTLNDDITGNGNDGGGFTGIFSVSNGSTLSLHQLVFEGENSTDGGVIDVRSSSSLFVRGCTFKNNIARNGGAIYVADSDIDVGGTTVFSNNSADSGGAVYADSYSVLNFGGNISFHRNSVGDDGGAIFVSSDSTIRLDGNTYFEKNTAGVSGGAVCADSYSVVDFSGITSFYKNSAGDGGGAISVSSNSTVRADGTNYFDENTATNDGGAVCADSYSVVDFSGNTSFYRNSAGDGGGAISVSSNSTVRVNGTNCFDKNTATDDGGAISAYLDSSILVFGNTYFGNNMAGDDGGALSAQENSFCRVEGDTNFDNNLGKDSGGAVNILESSMQIDGSTCFYNNTSQDDGGAVYIHRGSAMGVKGNTSFIANQAWQIGGGIYASFESTVNIDGNTSFFNNFAEDNGGAIYVGMTTTFYIDGHTSVTNNSANWPGGGGLYASHSEVNICGHTYMAFNDAYDGGAILAHRSDINIGGNALFAYNSADRDGGAMKTINSNTTITGGAELSSTSDLATGVASSTDHLDFEGISFTQNTAFIDGGAVLLTTPDRCIINDVGFTANEAMFGGAVSLTSTTQSSVEFRLCRFESNYATSGGALYLNGEGGSSVSDSRFNHNAAGETGGALFNAGALEVHDTKFTENVAQEDGLAIYNADSDLLVLGNVNFTRNTRSCPSGAYSATDDTSLEGCRFELVCAQCLNGCDIDPSNIAVVEEKPPICKVLPEGVVHSSTSTSLDTFDLEEGYYRVSIISSTVLECYQEDACIGGTNASNYCQRGYEGPYCAVCAAGFAPGFSNRCHECSGQNTALVAGCATSAVLLMLFVAAVVVSYLLQGSEHGADEVDTEARCFWRNMLSKVHGAIVKAIPVSAVSIVVVVVQILTQFTEVAGAVYPDEYEAFLSHMAFINVDISLILSRSCIITPDFYDRLVVATTGPLVVLLGCAGTFFAAKRRNRNFNAVNHRLKQKYMSVVIFIVFFVYSSVSFTILQTFVCDSLDDGKAYLRADYSITCNTDTYRAYQTYAWFMVFVYPFGVPAFFAWMLVRNRQELERSGRETISDLQSFRSLWSAYRPSCYYYEIVECGRRIVLTGAAVFVISDSAEQIALVLLLAVVFMFISESLSPFESRLDMWLYRWGNGIILASMYVALLLKVDLAVEGSHGSSTITALLIAANMFMLVTVAVQAVLLVRGLCVAKIQDKLNRAPSTFPSNTWLERAAELETPSQEVEFTSGRH